MTQPEFNLSAF